LNLGEDALLSNTKARGSKRSKKASCAWEPILQFRHFPNSYRILKEGRNAPMIRNSTIPTPAEHVVTAREALEPLYLRLEQEAEMKLLAAAMRAGWTADEAMSAIDDLRREEVGMAGGRRH
jgi:hypothetical protein